MSIFQREAMSERELTQLRALLEKFRRCYSWDERERPASMQWGHERATVEAISAVRHVQNAGPFYRFEYATQGRGPNP